MSVHKTFVHSQQLLIRTCSQSYALSNSFAVQQSYNQFNCVSVHVMSVRYNPYNRPSLYWPWLLRIIAEGMTLTVCAGAQYRSTFLRSVGRRGVGVRGGPLRGAACTSLGRTQVVREGDHSCGHGARCMSSCGSLKQLHDCLVGALLLACATLYPLPDVLASEALW